MAVVCIDIPQEIRMAAEQMNKMSSIIVKLNQNPRQMEISSDRLVKTIMLDPEVTAGVMRLINSPFYGRTNRVNSLPQAVMLFGSETVKNLASYTAILNTGFAQEKKSPLNPEEFWRHCLSTAIGCKLLAKKLEKGEDELETYFIAGLLHDVGKLLFIKVDPEGYSKAIWESERLGISLTFSELAHFGCSHTEAGGLLARQWNLDNFLVKIIEFHHSPLGNKSSPIQDILSIANNLSKHAQIGQSGNGVIEEIVAACSKRLGITLNSLDQIADQLVLQLEKASEFINIIKEQKKEWATM